MTNHSRILVSALAAVGVAAVAVGGQFAGAALFAKMQHLPPSVIGIFTLRDYWHAYGDVPAVKKALAACSFVSVAIPVGAIAAVCFAAFGTAKRELHGSARFAKAHEIRKTGLLDNEDGKPALIIGKYRG